MDNVCNIVEIMKFIKFDFYQPYIYPIFLYHLDVGILNNKPHEQLITHTK